MREMRVAAVVLAAGASTRLGHPKQLIQKDGESLLRRTARLAAEAGCAPVVVVLGFEAERMRDELDGLAVRAAVNPGWREGMGGSVRCGMEALGGPDAGGADAGLDAVLLVVCDQPRLSAEHLRSLLVRHGLRHGVRQRQAGAAVTASGYAGRAGVPAVFSAELFPQLLALEGDRGAREVIRRLGDAVETVAWPEGALDVDRAEDLERI